MTGIKLPSSLLKAPDGKCQKIYYSCSHASSAIDRKQGGLPWRASSGKLHMFLFLPLSHTLTQVRGVAFKTALTKIRKRCLPTPVIYYQRPFRFEAVIGIIVEVGSHRTQLKFLQRQRPPQRGDEVLPDSFLHAQESRRHVSAIQTLLPRPSC